MKNINDFGYALKSNTYLIDDIAFEFLAMLVYWKENKTKENLTKH